MQKQYPDDTASTGGKVLAGGLKQMYKLKLANRNLKTLLSIGGWTYSQAGHFEFITDDAKRATFVQDAVAAVENYGLDGM